MHDDDNIEFLLMFIGKTWLIEEFRKVDRMSSLKEIGVHYHSYHPYICFMYELRYLLRRAHIETKAQILMGEYHYILSNAGALLKMNIDLIVDKDDAIKRLRNPEQFYDFIWELEVGTMIGKSGVLFRYNNPIVDSRNDISAFIDNRFLQIECKNKIIENKLFKMNTSFAHIISNKLENIESLRGKIIQIEYDHARYEDAKIVANVIRDKFDHHSYQSILGRYKVRVLKLPFSTHPKALLNRENIACVIEINRMPKSELYNDYYAYKKTFTKLLFKFPGEATTLKNINTVLKQANKQLANGGVVFMQVPYLAFLFAISEIEKELAVGLSNIAAVKLIAIDLKLLEDQGVKVSREEKLILSSNANLILSEKEVAFLSQNMVFSKFT